MTDKQKKQAINFRKVGWSYGEIAKNLALSVNTVKSFFQRQTTPDATPELQKSKAAVCPQCSKPLPSHVQTKPRRFCSDACRMAWWKGHRQEVHRKVYYTFTCAHCGMAFISFGNKHRKFCSHACYIADRFGGDTGDTRTV